MRQDSGEGNQPTLVRIQQLEEQIRKLKDEKRSCRERYLRSELRSVKQAKRITELQTQCQDLYDRVRDLMVERETDKRLVPEHVVCPICKESNTYATKDGRHCPDCGCDANADGSVSI